MDERNWYVVNTKPHNERLVAAQLQPITDVFLPFIQVKRRKKSRILRVLEPLFPGYLFIRTSDDTAIWNQIRWKPGVRRILGDNEGYWTVPEEVIEDIKSRMGTKGYVVVKPQPTFKPGDKIKIIRGPLMGLDAIFEKELSGSERAQLLINFMRTHVRAYVSMADIQSISLSN